MRGACCSVTLNGEFNIRWVFGGLKFVMFVLTVVLGKSGCLFEFEFIGGGFGYGVGLC